MNLLVSCIVLIVVLIVPVIGTIFYAVHKKGDVSAAFSLRPFTFTLRAKERK
jgi:hypothetical protein